MVTYHKCPILQLIFKLISKLKRYISSWTSYQLIDCIIFSWNVTWALNFLSWMRAWQIQTSGYLSGEHEKTCWILIFSFNGPIRNNYKLIQIWNNTTFWLVCWRVFFRAKSLLIKSFIAIFFSKNFFARILYGQKLYLIKKIYFSRSSIHVKSEVGRFGNIGQRLPIFNFFVNFKFTRTERMRPAVKGFLVLYFVLYFVFVSSYATITSS